MSGKHITAQTGPTGITIIEVPPGTAVVAVEFDGQYPPAQPGQDAPDAPRIVQALSETGIVAAAFGCPHGAVAIVRIAPSPADQEEDDCAQASVRESLAMIFRHGEHAGLATPARETRNCTRRYYGEDKTG